MSSAEQPIASSFNTFQAFIYGELVSIAYNMYDNDPNNLTPTPPSHFQPPYKFIAWVIMRDFIAWDGKWVFYGLIAQNTSKTSEYVLAIRGTSSWIEWYDDLRSMELVPFPDFGGSVGDGFYQIYQTMQVIYRSTASSPTAAAQTQSLKSAGTFAQQVAAAIRLNEDAERASALTPQGPSTPATVVVGHSLGSALATLYVADNASLQGGQKVATPALYTLASPRVGDSVFATKFDGLGLTSWRVVYDMDLVPMLPPEILGFQHIQTEYLYDYDSGIWPSPECDHSHITYLHLLNPKSPLEPGCVWSAATAAARRNQATAPVATDAAPPAPARKEIVLSAPEGSGTTINITIKVGGIS
jgi:Lipase (class 3)